MLASDGCMRSLACIFTLGRRIQPARWVRSTVQVQVSNERRYNAHGPASAYLIELASSCPRLICARISCVGQARFRVDEPITEVDKRLPLLQYASTEVWLSRHDSIVIQLLRYFLPFLPGTAPSVRGEVFGEFHRVLHKVASPLDDVALSTAHGEDNLSSASVPIGFLISRFSDCVSEPILC